ncbi:aminotransferase class I/II-fold pyridoxal phosphate-dependent enzyme [Microcella daejeonensis]|uniref:Aminotransferase class I/II-fold pyridoxal phosphate-dependent enzyme n=1 Tax=Microcella daejeonensis TaxID=2994971 RepID=A0A9E8MJF8_9MICO|nr:aminotransferase class I/II-fold pyridoxal phosphate-dependent enzyme [Microcella daejeonensis]WAB80670.1 aminotransferase class I/II-fold pyridoxal phosphate-dependent enzyme [Microcella daejeonensis]
MSDDAPWMRTVRAAGLLGPDGVARPTIFAEMSALAARYDAVNLGQGFPDEDAPAAVLDAAVAAIRAGVNQYPPGRGEPDLRAAIAEHRLRFRGDVLDPATEVLVTAGATEALAATLLALVRPGDEVAVIEPAYDAYAALIGLTGARMARIPLEGPEQQPSIAAIDAAIGPRTRVVLVNSPHNPTGTVIEPALLDRIARRAAEHDAVIVADEVYEHLVYDGRTHTSMSSLEAGQGRTLVISSAAKTFRVTGWKIGWITGPAALIDAVMAVKQFLTYVNGAPFQPAVAVGLRLGDDYFDGLRASLERRRDLLSAGLEAAGFAVSPSRGSYFVVADPGPLGIDDGDAFARELVRETRVASIPLIAFAPGSTDARTRRSLRFAFCRTDEAVEEAVSRLARLGRR